MAGLTESALEFKQSIEVATPGSKTLSDLLATKDAPLTHRFGEAQRSAAEDNTNKFLAFLAEAEEAVSQVCSG